jgi:hypothetical protein
MTHADVDALLARVLDLAAPPKREPLSEWADPNRVLSSEAGIAGTAAHAAVPTRAARLLITWFAL